MATPETMQMPALGEQGEPCGGCGTPLAADQRYCLNCGQRRAGPRVDYRQHLGAPSSGANHPPEQLHAAAADSVPDPPQPERDYAPLAAVGGIAVLGLMLLVGVLIGKGNGTTTSAPAPIVRLGGEVGAASTGEEESTKPTTGAKEPKKAAGVDTGAKTVKGGLTGEAASNSDATVQATTNDLESLNDTSGESYQDAIKKLPDKIATPGAPPPVDTSKAPGGGGAAETIE
jgi:hypothetical protein